MKLVANKMLEKCFIHPLKHSEKAQRVEQGLDKFFIGPEIKFWLGRGFL